MVMPDCSLLVTTFSRHSWLLQRIATRVISILTFVGEKYPVNSAHADFMPALARAVLFSGRFLLSNPNRPCLDSLTGIGWAARLTIGRMKARPRSAAGRHRLEKHQRRNHAVVANDPRWADRRPRNLLLKTSVDRGQQLNAHNRRSDHVEARR